MSTEIAIGGVVIDPESNLESEKARLTTQAEIVPANWAVEFAGKPPVYHGTTLEATSQWAQSGSMSLLSHKAVHGLSAFFRAPENTPGQTCGEDVRRGLDNFVFASVGRTALSNPGAFSSVIVLDHDVLNDGLTSFLELGAFDGILLSPKERYGQHSEPHVEKANQQAFERYARTLVKGGSFKDLFEIYLTQNFDSVDQFLSSYDLVPGKPDLPRSGTVAHAELMAFRNFCKRNSIPIPPYVEGGCLYPGPQLIVKDKVSKDNVSGVILYDPTDRDPNVKATAKRVERRNVAVEVIGPAAVMAMFDRVDVSLFDRGSDDFKTHALKNAVFNICFSDIANSFQAR